MMEFRSCALLVNEMLFVDQILSLPVILSKRTLHSNLLSLLAVIGTPRYLRGSPSSWNPVI